MIAWGRPDDDLLAIRRLRPRRERDLHAARAGLDRHLQRLGRAQFCPGRDGDSRRLPLLRDALHPSLGLLAGVPLRRRGDHTARRPHLPPGDETAARRFDARKDDRQPRHLDPDPGRDRPEVGTRTRATSTRSSPRRSTDRRRAHPGRPDLLVAIAVLATALLWVAYEVHSDRASRSAPAPRTSAPPRRSAGRRTCSRRSLGRSAPGSPARRGS